MGNENERKRDPARDRQERRGHDFDDAKTTGPGGGETTVGLTGGGGGGGQSVGSGGTVGGSDAFLTGDQSASGGGQSEIASGSPTLSPAEAQASSRDVESGQVLTGDQEGDDNFGGRTGSGTSAIAANNSSADLGASGNRAPDSDEAGFIGRESGDDRDEPNQGGFAEQGRGAPEGSQSDPLDAEESSDRSS